MEKSRRRRTQPPAPVSDAPAFDAPSDLAGWLTLVGLVVALASLFLPWVSSAGFLIGAPGSLP